MALRVVTAAEATDLLVSVAEAKAQLRVDSSDDDALIGIYCRAAQRLIEGEAQRRYSAQVLEWVRDDWCGRMVLPIAAAGDGDGLSVDWVKYADENGVQQTLDPATMYWVRPAGQTLAIVQQRFAVWPLLGDAAERVVVQITVAAPAADTVDNAKLAAQLLVAHWYENREAAVGTDAAVKPQALPLGVNELLDLERWAAC